MAHEQLWLMTFERHPSISLVEEPGWPELFSLEGAKGLDGMKAEDEWYVPSVLHNGAAILITAIALTVNSISPFAASSTFNPWTQILRKASIKTSRNPNVRLPASNTWPEPHRATLLDSLPSTDLKVRRYPLLMPNRLPQLSDFSETQG